jgi:hypothetical protein
MSRKDQIKAIIAREVRAVFGDRELRVFIFGSQAGLPELIPADIDLGLDAGEKLPSELVRRLSHLLNTSKDTLYSFDVVDLHAVERGFKEAVEEEHREWLPV